MKRNILSLILVICIMLIPVVSNAETDAISWDFSDGVLTISGSGAMDDLSSPSNAPWADHRANIVKVVIEDGITHIGAKSFYACTALTSVQIGNGVTTIGADAFARCTKLTDVRVNCTQEQWEAVTISTGNDYLTGATYVYTATGTFGDGFTWHFDGVDTLTISGTNPIYTAPDEIPWAEYRSQITHLVIQEGITAIEEYAFKGIKVKTISLPNGLTKIGVSAFTGSGLTEVTIPDSVEVICEEAFAYSLELKTVNLPKNLKYIYSTSFLACSGLEQMNISEDNTKYATLDGNLYSDDYSVLYKYAPGKKDTAFIIPESVVTVNAYAFESSKVSEVTISKNVQTISFGKPQYFVSELNSKLYLDKIIVDEDNPYYTAVGGCLFSKDKRTYVQYAGVNNTEYTVPDGTITIGAYAFEGSGLVNVYLPDTVQEVRPSAFHNCFSLETINIPYGVTTIEREVFQGCSSLKSIYIPSTVVNIGAFAFDDCINLTDIYYGGTEMQWISSGIRGSSFIPFYGRKTIMVHLNEQSTAEFTALCCNSNNDSISGTVQLNDEQRAATPVLVVYKEGKPSYISILDKPDEGNSLTFDEKTYKNMQGERLVKMMFINLETLEPYGTPAKVIMLQP